MGDERAGGMQSDPLLVEDGCTAEVGSDRGRSRLIRALEPRRLVRHRGSGRIHDRAVMPAEAGRRCTPGVAVTAAIRLGEAGRDRGSVGQASLAVRWKRRPGEPLSLRLGLRGGQDVLPTFRECGNGVPWNGRKHDGFTFGIHLGRDSEAAQFLPERGLENGAGQHDPGSGEPPRVE